MNIPEPKNKVNTSEYNSKLLQCQTPDLVIHFLYITYHIQRKALVFYYFRTIIYYLFVAHLQQQ